MSKFAKRVLLAACISASGFAATFTWYHYTSRSQFGRGDAKPVARLVTLVNEVQRKQVTKLIWQPISENEILYAGEAIRTGSGAEAAIEFLNSDTRIDLEPDSAIVLEESTTGELALNFISGNMYVKSDESAGASGITLKSGDKNIALGKSEISLGKSTGEELDLQVLKGTAAVDGQTLEQGGSLKLITPSTETSIYVDPEKRDLVEFTWQPVDASYQVYVESGPTRNSIKPLQGAVGPGAAGKLQSFMKLGRVYYRIVARSSDPEKFPELRSPVFKNTVFAKTPPTLLAPENEEAVAVNLKLPTVRFAWTNPSNFEKALIELGSDQNMSKVAFKKEIADGDEYFLDIKSPGKYYWRVSGYLEGLKTPITSPVQSFTLQVNKELPPPGLVSPTAEQKIPFDRIKKSGLTFEWQKVPGVVGYILDIESQGNEPVQVKTKLTKVRVKDLSVGDFRYKLTSVGKERTKEGRFKRIESKPSPLTSFTLTETPRLEWADKKTEEEQYYLSLKPTAELKWAKGPAGTVNYQMRIANADKGFDEETPIKKYQKLGARFEVPADGFYFAEVEAVDKSGFPIARTPRRKIRILPAPLLPAPLFAEATPEEINANGRGQARVGWKEVKGANEYIMLVKDPDSDKVREYRFSNLNGALRGLMPGDYNISLKSVDEHGRPGPAGEERILRVPATSDVRAPKVKGLKIK